MLMSKIGIHCVDTSLSCIFLNGNYNNKKKKRLKTPAKSASWRTLGKKE